MSPGGEPPARRICRSRRPQAASFLPGPSPRAGRHRSMNFSTAQRRSLTWLALGAAGFVLLWLLAPVLTPFLIGAVLAYALHPAVERLAVRSVPRIIAVVWV